MTGLFLNLAWLYVRVVAETIWECKWVQRSVWAVAFGFLVRCLISGRLSIEEVVINIAIEIVLRVHLLR
mgnify:CR=1 FL=1